MTQEDKNHQQLTYELETMLTEEFPQVLSVEFNHYLCLHMFTKNGLNITDQEYWDEGEKQSRLGLESWFLLKYEGNKEHFNHKMLRNLQDEEKYYWIGTAKKCTDEQLRNRINQVVEPYLQLEWSMKYRPDIRFWPVRFLLQHKSFHERAMALAETGPG